MTLKDSGDWSPFLMLPLIRNRKKIKAWQLEDVWDHVTTATDKKTD